MVIDCLDEKQIADYFNQFQVIDKISNQLPTRANPDAIQKEVEYMQSKGVDVSGMRPLFRNGKLYFSRVDGVAEVLD